MRAGWSDASERAKDSETERAREKGGGGGSKRDRKRQRERDRDRERKRERKKETEREREGGGGGGLAPLAVAAIEIRTHGRILVICSFTPSEQVHLPRSGGNDLYPTLKATQGQISSQSPTDATSGR